MQEITLYESKSEYRDDFRIRGFKFGSGEKSLAVVGSLRGNEFQQLYAASHLVKKLSELEKQNLLVPEKEILVIPCGNPYSMNIRKRFWTIDNTDINRMFPGYSEGETTQRIAAGIFNAVKDFKRGIQFASFYIRGSFAPHIRMMKTGFENAEMAKEFGLPFVVIRDPRPFDTTTLNYNWQIWESNAFSIYTTNTEKVEKKSAEEAVKAILRFMKAEGILKEEEKLKQVYVEEKISCSKDSSALAQNDNGSFENDNIAKISNAECFSFKDKIRVITDSDLMNVRTKNAGFFEGKVKPGENVKKDEVLAEIYDSYTAQLLEKIASPCNGTILFIHAEDMCYAESTVCKIISKK